MTEKLKSAARQALEILEIYRPLSLPIKVSALDKVRETAIEALREALDQQQRECKLSLVDWSMNPVTGEIFIPIKPAEQDKPLYRKVLREILDAYEQANQEPAAAYKDAPSIIYLQTGCDDSDPFECGCSFNEWGDVSWCAEKIHDTDIPYIRADYAPHMQHKKVQKINDGANTAGEENE